MKFLLTIFAVAFITSVFGQTGDLDTTFNEFMNDHYGNGRGVDGTVVSIALQSDGKAVIAGNFVGIGSSPVSGLARMFPDGGQDYSFQPVLLPEGCTVWQVTLLGNDQMLIAGNFTSVNGVTRNGIALLNSDGNPDLSFDPGAGVSSGQNIFAFDRLPDGKILIGGDFTGYNNTSYNYLAKLNADGTMDTGFNSGTGPDHSVKAIAALADGKAYIGGAFYNYDGDARYLVARINTDGSADTSFNVTGSALYYSVCTILPVDEDKVVIGGSFGYINDEPLGNMVRLNADGSIDHTFIGQTWNGSVNRIRKEDNDHLLVCGPSSNITRINNDGSIAQTGSFGYLDGIRDMAKNPDGTILVGGLYNYNFTQIGSSLARATPQLYADATYIPFTSANGEVSVITTQDDGKILIGGDFYSYNGVYKSGMARLNPDGTLDSTFTSSVGPMNAILVQPDGKILVGGNMQNKLMRLNADGSIDPGFIPVPNPYSDPIWVLALQPDGKILAGGEGSYAYIARFNSDGSPDYSFMPPNQLSNAVLTISIQNDGKIFIGGSFAGGRKRLNADGSIDPTFDQGTAPAMVSINESIIQPDGKILVGGAIFTLNGITTGNVARLNTDGTIDGSFAPVSVYPVQGMILQPDQKIVIACTQNTSSNPILSGLYRLNSDGTFDNTTFFNNPVLPNYSSTPTLAMQEDGRLLFGIKEFAFTNTNMLTHNGIVRLLNDSPGYSGLQLFFHDVTDVTCTTQGTATAQAYWGAEPYSYQWISPVSGNQTVDFASAGVYTCVVTDADGVQDTASLLINAPEFLSDYELSVNIVAGSFRPGFEATVQIDAYNDGCITAAGQVKLVVDTLLTLIDAQPPVTIISGDTLIWDFINLSYDSMHFTPIVTFLTDTTAIIGDTIDLTLTITPISGDGDTTNNVRSYQFPVVNGYDPNDKAVYPHGSCDAGIIEMNQRLTYTVRFQNTGNSHAVNIVVLDSLDSDLDPGSLRVIGQSHYVWTEVLDNQIVKFHFDGIYLPDSTNNEPESHGYVIYEIDPMGSAVSGSEISNGASIFFDFNPPVATNYVRNLLYAGSYLNTQDTVTQGSCASYMWNGEVYNESGIYTYSTQSIYGCDSTATLLLTINQNSVSEMFVDTIDSYTFNDTTYTTSGIYTHTLINSTGCDSIVTLNLSLAFTGIAESDQKNTTIYPNPTTGLFTIAFDAAIQHGTLIVHDLQGKEVLRTDLNGKQQQIDLSGVNNGVYLVCISDQNNRSIIHRIIKL